MNIKALQLAARFALSPNMLGFCGKDSAPSKFEACITQGNCAGTQKELTHFNFLWPYLQTIAAMAGLNPLTYPVVASYWLGDPILEKATIEHYEILLKYFAKQGVSEEMLTQMRQNPPKRFVPFHLWQVLQASAMEGHTNLNAVNNCMVRWGTVQEIKGATVTTILYTLSKKYKLKKKEATVQLARKLVPKLQIGSTVAVHWGWVSMVLNEKEATTLRHWTEQVLLNGESI